MTLGYKLVDRRDTDGAIAHINSYDNIEHLLDTCYVLGSVLSALQSVILLTTLWGETLTDSWLGSFPTWLLFTSTRWNYFFSSKQKLYSLAKERRRRSSCSKITFSPLQARQNSYRKRWRRLGGTGIFYYPDLWKGVVTLQNAAHACFQPLYGPSVSGSEVGLTSMAQVGRDLITMRW